MVWILMLAATALAQEAVKLEVIHTVHAPKQPALIVKPQAPASRLKIALTCSGVQAGFDGPASAQTEIRISIPVPAGTHTCTGQLHGSFTDGTEGSMPLSFQVAVQDPIQLSVSMDDLDLEGHKVQVHLNQPVSQIDVDVFGETGQQIGAATVGATSRTPATVQWEQAQEPIVRLRITATGTAGMSTALDLFPWSYKIPHDEVIFSSGSAVIRPSEIPKLEAARVKIAQVVTRFSPDKLGFTLPMQLYVAGYTDTVGNSVTNRLLSERRAEALASWFKASGFGHPIHFQGFGEGALAVVTPDETDEPANRRALYIIAAETPTVSAALPTKNWKQLR